MAAALAAAGCAHFPLTGRERASAPVRPAAPGAQDRGNEEEFELALLGHPVVGLATPRDAIARVVGPEMTCSGTLVADDLVLTAHHCVVARGPRGEFTRQVVDASKVDVELGGDFLPWGNVGLRAILAPPCGEAGGRGDVAVLVLERKLVGMYTMAIGEHAPRADELVDPVGFGRCALSPDGIRRRDREGGAVTSVSRGTFETLASVCPGDSGGPVLDRATHEVVGVVSLSAMDYDESTLGRSVFARVDEMPQLLAYARLVADGADPGDLPPLSCE